MADDNSKNHEFILLQAMTAVQLFAFLAESPDLPLIQNVYERLRILMQPHMANPKIRQATLCITFNTMYSYLTVPELGRACEVFEQLSEIGRAYAMDLDFCSGLAGAATNLVSALIHDGQDERAAKIYREITLRYPSAGRATRFADALSNLSLVMVNKAVLKAHGIGIALSSMQKLGELAFTHPEENCLLEGYLKCGVTVVTAYIDAGMYDSAEDTLEAMLSASKQHQDILTIQDIYIQAVGNAIIGFSKAACADRATHSYERLNDFSGTPEVHEAVAQVRCAAGLHLFDLYTRLRRCDDATRTFLEGSSSIKGHDAEGQLRNYESRALLDLAKDGDPDVSLSVYTALIRFAYNDRDEESLREVIALGALAFCLNDTIPREVQAAIIKQLSRLAEAYPEEESLRQFMITMGTMSELFAPLPE